MKIRLLTCALLLISTSVALAQNAPVPDPPMTIEDFISNNRDPDVNAYTKLHDWQMLDIYWDHLAVLQFQFMNNQKNLEMDAVVAAIGELAESQARMAMAIEDLVTLRILEYRNHPWPPTTPVNINTALPEELQEVPGIGPSLASSIYNARQGAPFGSVDDLILIPGMTQTLLDRIKPFITVQ